MTHKDPEPRPLFGPAWDEWYGRQLRAADEIGFKRDAELIAQGHNLNDPYENEDHISGHVRRRTARTHEQIEGAQDKFV